MPYVRKRKYQYRRRVGRYGGRKYSGYTTRYGGRKRRRVSRRTKASTIVPKTLYSKLYFSQYGQFATGGSSYTLSVFRQNGPQDPLYALGGGSCTGFAELAAIYGSHRVVGSKISIWGYSTCQTPFLFFVVARPTDGAIMTSAADCLNRALEYGRHCMFRKVIPYGSGTSYPQFKLSMYRSMKSMVGAKAAIDNDYAASTATYPTSQTFWDVGLVALDATSTTLTANVLIRITYYIKFSELVVPYS